MVEDSMFLVVRLLGVEPRTSWSEVKKHD